jgi:hypothetical protein
MQKISCNLHENSSSDMISSSLCSKPNLRLIALAKERAAD